jgi:hypothetical protein
VLGATNAGMTLTLLAWGIDQRPDRRAARDRDRPHGAALALGSPRTSNEFAALVAALVATGAFGASVNSASGRAVMHWFAADERGLALGIRQAAIPIGGFAGASRCRRSSPPAAFTRRSRARRERARVGGARRRRAARAARRRGDRREFVSPLARPADVAPLLRERVRARRAARDHGFVVLFLHDARGFSTAHAALVLAAVQVGGVACAIVVGRRSDREGAAMPLFIRLSASLAVALATAAASSQGRSPSSSRARRRRNLGMSWNGSRSPPPRKRRAAAQRCGDRLPADGARSRRNRHSDRVRSSRRRRVVADRVPCTAACSATGAVLYAAPSRSATQ